MSSMVYCSECRKHGLAVGYSENSCPVCKHRQELAEAKAEVKRLVEQVGELQDFAIWMTGCGYDFCQHKYFVKQRDKLLANNLQPEAQDE